MSAASTSVVVVEIDTRKGPVKTVFESSIDNQSEQATAYRVELVFKRDFAADKAEPSKTDGDRPFEKATRT